MTWVNLKHIFVWPSERRYRVAQIDEKIRQTSIGGGFKLIEFFLHITGDVVIVDGDEGVPYVPGDVVVVDGDKGVHYVPGDIVVVDSDEGVPCVPWDVVVVDGDEGVPYVPGDVVVVDGDEGVPCLKTRQLSRTSGDHRTKKR